MKFKNWFNEEVVKSGEKSFGVHSGAREPIEYHIYKNPSAQELRNCMQSETEIRKAYNVVGAGIRGFLNTNGDIFICPQSVLTHEDIADAVQTDIRVGFYMEGDMTLR